MDIFIFSILSSHYISLSRCDYGKLHKKREYAFFTKFLLPHVEILIFLWKKANFT